MMHSSRPSRIDCEPSANFVASHAMKQGATQGQRLQRDLAISLIGGFIANGN